MSEDDKLLPCATCPWRVDKDASTIPRYSHEKALALECTVGEGDDFRQIMACHHSGADMIACKGYLAQVGWTNINVRLLLYEGKIENPDAVYAACQDAGIVLHESFEDVINKLSRSVTEGESK